MKGKDKQAYTDEEKRWLLNNHKEVYIEEISKILNKSISSLKSQMFRQGLSVKRH